MEILHEPGAYAHAHSPRKLCHGIGREACLQDQNQLTITLFGPQHFCSVQQVTIPIALDCQRRTTADGRFEEVEVIPRQRDNPRLREKSLQGPLSISPALCSTATSTGVRSPQA